jgi:hypothetical protein
MPLGFDAWETRKRSFHEHGGADCRVVREKIRKTSDAGYKPG